MTYLAIRINNLVQFLVAFSVVYCSRFRLNPTAHCALSRFVRFANKIYICNLSSYGDIHMHLTTYYKLVSRLRLLEANRFFVYIFFPVKHRSIAARVCLQAGVCVCVFVTNSHQWCTQIYRSNEKATPITANEQPGLLVLLVYGSRRAFFSFVPADFRFCLLFFRGTRCYCLCLCAYDGVCLCRAIYSQCSRANTSHPYRYSSNYKVVNVFHKRHTTEKLADNRMATRQRDFFLSAIDFAGAFRCRVAFHTSG